jgi:hypothetical protein
LFGQIPPRIFMLAPQAPLYDRSLMRKRYRTRRGSALVKLNRDATELVFGPLPGRPTFSTCAGNAISKATGMRRRSAKAIFHGGVGIAVAKFAATRGVSKEASAVFGLLAFLGLESYDPSRTI